MVKNGLMFPSLSQELLRASSTREVFEIAIDALMSAGFSVSVDVAPQGAAELWSRPATFLHAEPAVCIRVDCGGAPHVLLTIRHPRLRDEDVPAATLLGGQISLACESIRTIAELATRNRLAEAAALTPDFQQFLRIGVVELIQYLRCEGLSLYLMEPSGEALSLAEHVGGTPEAEAAFAQVPIGKGLVGAVAEDGKARWWHPEDFAESARPVIARMGFGTGAAVALRTRSRVVGVMNAAWLERRAVSSDELKSMEHIGTHFASTIEAQQLTDQLRRSVEDLQHTRTELIHHQRMAAVGELAAQVAHEVRNPLAVLFNAVGVLRRSPESSERQQLMGMILDEGEKLNGIMENLVQLAQPSTPKLEDVQLRELLETTVAAAQRDAREPTGTIDLTVSAPLPNIPADRRLLRQALKTVIENAFDAAPGRAQVGISTAVELETSRLRIDVKDAGPGVHVDMRDRIFDWFFSTRASGSGLGLALARRILRAHGGDLVLTDPSPGNTIFSLYLPLGHSRQARTA